MENCVTFRPTPEEGGRTWRRYGVAGAVGVGR
jgi:hypothetical protein